MLHSISNAKKIKDIISSYIPESTWIRGKKGISLTPRQEKLSQAYFELDDIIKVALKGSEDGKYYEYLNAKATDIYRLSKAIKNMVVDETGQPAKTSQLVSTFTGGARTAGKRDLFKRLNEINDKTEDVIKAMNKFRQRKSLEKFAGRAAPWIPAALGLGYMGNRLFDRD